MFFHNIMSTTNSFHSNRMNHSIPFIVCHCRRRFSALLTTRCEHCFRLHDKFHWNYSKENSQITYVSIRWLINWIEIFSKKKEMLNSWGFSSFRCCCCCCSRIFLYDFEKQIEIRCLFEILLSQRLGSIYIKYKLMRCTFLWVLFRDDAIKTICW